MAKTLSGITLRLKSDYAITLIVGDEMKRMLEREAKGDNPHRGVPFQGPFYGAL